MLPTTDVRERPDPRQRLQAELLESRIAHRPGEERRQRVDTNTEEALRSVVVDRKDFRLDASVVEEEGRVAHPSEPRLPLSVRELGPAVQRRTGLLKPHDVSLRVLGQRSLREPLPPATSGGTWPEPSRGAGHQSIVPEDLLAEEGASRQAQRSVKVSTRGVGRLCPLEIQTDRGQ